MLKHVVAYITGAAKGIGRAVAEQIICQGGRVILADLSTKAAKIAEAMGDRAVFACTDVRLEKDILEGMKKAKDKFGGVNVVINSAGILGCERMHDFKDNKPHSQELFKSLIDVNLWGTINVTRLIVGMMAENTPDRNCQRGVIINLASMFAYEPPPGYAVYGCTKAAIAGITLSLAREFAVKGIRVVGICPGFIETPMTSVIPPEEKKRLSSMMLSPQRFGCAEEVADLIVACIENPLINGENIRIDMGFRYNQVDDGQKDPKDQKKRL